MNDVVFCTLNTLDLFSIERTRKENRKYTTDATTYAADGTELFIEKEWKGMLEPIPYGPQAVSLDIGFQNATNVFGIPERINSFKVKSTVEYKTAEDDFHSTGGKLLKIKEEEPFRLFTCDHFNDRYPNHSQYGAVPIMHVRSDNKKGMLGIYWCNASDTFVDVLSIDDKKHAHWMSETGHLQLFIYAGATPSVVFFK